MTNRYSDVVQDLVNMNGWVIVDIDLSRGMVEQIREFQDLFFEVFNFSFDYNCFNKPFSIHESCLRNYKELQQKVIDKNLSHVIVIEIYEPTKEK